MSRLIRRWAAATVSFVIVVNLAIAALSSVLQATADEPDVSTDGVGNLRVIDDRVLRGGAPSAVGYRNLARRGVTTVVDLRAERDLDVPIELLDELGVDLVRLPIRDGQTPTEQQVRTFLETVEHADGRVFVHCGAGVGRTGAMAAAYAVATWQRSSLGALRDILTVGPPSLEQIYYATFVDIGRFGQPPAVISTLSRFLDAPRRIWSRARLRVFEMCPTTCVIRKIPAQAAVTRRLLGRRLRGRRGGRHLRLHGARAQSTRWRWPPTRTTTR